uniref:Ionotropic receptor 75c n=1 Tax=Bradysia odoriphaga TaxID=1564500 RepID=A0A6B9C9J7_9DIPT|nr:ionotropic receptor 75c [Bradysia odoriphaga]
MVCLLATTVTSTNVNLIKDYIKYVNVKTVLFITCERTTKLLEMVTKLHSIDTYVNVWSISNESVTVASNASNFTQFFVRPKGSHAVIVDLDCEQIKFFLRQSSHEVLFHSERSWLMFSKSIGRSYGILGQENINLDADVTLVTRLNHNEYRISDVYNPSKIRGGRLNITTIGTWGRNRRLNMTTEHLRIERQRDLGGLTMLATITLPSPIPNNQTFMEHLESNEFPQINSLDRSTYKLFKLMMEMHNFKVLIHRTDHWVTVDSMGHWTGTLGMVQRGEVDFAITGARHQDDRYGQVDATANSYYIQLKFLFQHPKSVTSSNVFLSPLNEVVWIVLVLFGLFTAFSLRQSFLLENKRQCTDYTYSNSLLIVFGMLFQQGYGGSTNYMSSKVFVISVLLLSFLMFQFYSSFIISSLLIEPPKTIKTMKQLAHSKLKCYADDVPYVIDNLKHSQDESANEIYHQIMRDAGTRIVSVQNGLDLMKKHGYALNTDVSYAYPKLKAILTDKQICNLQEVSYIQSIHGYPVVPVKSPLKELIKLSLRKFHETGIMSHHWDIWIGKKPKCNKSNIELVQVDWTHFVSSLYVLATGITTSVGFLSIEVFTNWYHRTRGTKQLRCSAPVWWIKC